ncbi:response regulator [Natronincola ferrireducens]|uniref:Transcriptional regulatory protein n=1 Tax=Natronincola ferrireducens TaxID=393762 RepID=A0A1G9FXP3_9FIRM|nr:response regulator [Natronincola ferrireducens]SDK93128.1 two-component system, CitB family, response regulator DctR [Natronincola ferrireducens]
MIKVIIVEDDPMVAEINRKYVESMEGFQVVSIVSNGEEAFKAIKSMVPDLIILDIYIPKINGLQLLKNIRSEELDVDVILVTAAKDVASIQEVFKWGVVDYLVKPFEFQRFKTALEDYKHRKINLTKKEKVDQSDIDKYILGKKNKSNELYLNKGMHQKTMDVVKNYIMKETTPKSAQEIAETLGMARVTVRRYLEYLTETGEVEVEIRYGTVGRPQHLYIYKQM